MSDTIAAISTPLGEGGIGIVRISGKKALSIADKVFRSPQEKKPSKFESHKLHYGHIIDSEGRIIDEVLLSVMFADRSYTREDSVEINCHSGIVVLRKILDLVIENGARLAEPGEFTKRAFLNGRIDLSQAEAVLGIIEAKTEAALRAAIGQLEGHLAVKIKEIRETLLDIRTQIEAEIDFPEEDIPFVSPEEVLKKTERAKTEIEKVLEKAEQGIILRKGILTAICGKPNVGKSSLFNALLKKDRAIVTPVPGTTRDTVEEVIDLKGIPFYLVDTAGIRKSKNLVEKEGIIRSQNSLKKADIVLFIIDGSRDIEKEDKQIAREVKNKKLLLIINKIDLPQKVSPQKLCQDLDLEAKVVSISATEERNLPLLEKAITDSVWQGDVYSSAGDLLISNLRQKESLTKARQALINFKQGIEKEVSEEFLAIDLKEAIDSLGEISGETASDDILERIFSKFCIGK